MGILLLICLLTIFGMSFDFVLSRFKDKRLVLKLFLGILLTATLIGVYIPFKFVRYKKPPEVYTYLKSSTPENSTFAVYPYNKTQEAFFWLPIHERLLVNIRDYTYDDFSSEDFTKNLDTVSGLDYLKSLGVDYLIIHKSIEDENIFFMESTLLSLEKELDNYLLYSVRR